MAYLQEVDTCLMRVQMMCKKEIYLLFLVAIILDSCASKPRSVDNSPTLNPDVQRFFDRFNITKDGRMSYEQFKKSCEEAKAPGTIEKCRYYFDLYDRNHDHLIEKSEMK
jgi:Ca2+-binding EF-hand superfamily protein